MKQIIFLFFLASSLPLSGQYTISGTFSPPEDYTWIIANYLEPGQQNYVAHTNIIHGKFTLKLPEGSAPGVYRLVYALPQEEYYFDVIVNEEEEIQLGFHEQEGVHFLNSTENRVFNAYFEAIYQLENRLVQWYSSQQGNTTDLEKILQELQSVQVDYEKESQGLLTQHFVKANSPYIPTPSESVFDYINNKKSAYFKALDLKNPVLQASGFLTHKVTNYVFTALPPKELDALETQKAIQGNLLELNTQMAGVSPKYQFQTYYTLWKQAISLDYDLVAGTLYETYLKPLSKITGNTGKIEEIHAFNQLQLGALAPEIRWDEDNLPKKLSDFHGADHYVLVFWSSTCSHCLQELPQLHEKLKDRQNLKVLAVGLEDEENLWQSESAKMGGFEHVLALGKWENEYAKTYNIQRTPSYFILDRDKHIVAKPENGGEVLKFLEGT
ncbi:MAG: thioredoxin family protein [Bacteroidota bacterium]